MSLLVTRPAPDDERTAGALRACGHDVLTAPMLRMETLDWAIPDRPYAGVVMTSANSARAIAGDPRCAGLTMLPAFTVGRRSAQAAQAAGFRDVHCAHGDRNALAQMLRAQRDAGSRPLLYLAGEDRAGDIELGPSAAAVITVVVYRMVEAGRFPAAVESALARGQIEGVLHFSRRSAQAYINCALRIGLIDCALAPLHYCLSRQVAEPLVAPGLVAPGLVAPGLVAPGLVAPGLVAPGLVGHNAAGIRIAPQPDEAALIALVKLCTD
jgi:uroporphyrinogen-III synthase